MSAALVRLVRVVCRDLALATLAVALGCWIGMLAAWIGGAL